MSNNNRRSSLQRLVQDIVDCIHLWWRVDRIRASPQEGRLLRITPGSIVCVAGALLEVTQRVVHDTPLGPLVRYTCVSPDGESDLWIAAVPRLAISWSRTDEEQDLSPDAIEIWTPQR